MADGAQRGYGANSNKAAAAAGCDGDGCPSCTKAGLPILLTRPGLADKRYADARKAAIEPLLTGIAEPELKHLGYVMRTLRKGYIHAYYEKWHTSQIQAQKGWQAFKVDEGGYLTPLRVGQAGSQEAFSCDRTAGYAGAMMFSIPDAKNTKRVWVAYSDHPWSEPVRLKYAGKDKKDKEAESLRNKRMTCINVPNASIDAPNVQPKQPVQLKDTNIEAVIDYAPTSAQMHVTPQDALKGNPHPRLWPKDAIAADDSPIPKRGENAADLMAGAQAVIDAGEGQFTIDDAMIVGVADPVGVTREAANLRVTLTQRADAWLGQQAKHLHKDRPNITDKKEAQKLVYWQLSSAIGIQGLLNSIEARKVERLKSTKRYRDGKWIVMLQTEFEKRMASGDLPSGAAPIPVPVWGFKDWTLEGLDHLKFSSQTMEHFGASNKKEMLGQLHKLAHRWNTSKYATRKEFPAFVTVDPHAPSKSNIKDDADDLTADIRDNLKGADGSKDYKSFLRNYNDKLDTDNKNRREFDDDYVAWLNSSLRKLITEYDYNTETPADGVAYAAAVGHMTEYGALPPVNDQQGEADNKEKSKSTQQKGSVPQTGKSKQQATNGTQQLSASTVAYRKLFTTNPNDTENLLVRAALGNQTRAFDAFVAHQNQSNQNKQQPLQTLLTLTQFKTGRTTYLKVVAHDAAELIMAQIGQMLTVLNATQHLTDALREQATTLAGALAITGYDGGDVPMLIRVRMPVSTWIELQHTPTLPKHQKGVGFDLVSLRDAIAFKTPPQLAKKTMDVFFWSKKSPAGIGSALGNATIAAGTTAVYADWLGTRAESLTRQMNFEELRMLRQRHRFMLSSERVPLLALGMLVLNGAALIQAWNKIDALDPKERVQARFSVAVYGLGSLGSTVDTYVAGKEMIARRAARRTGEEMAETSLLRLGRVVGPVLGACASAIAAVQCAMGAVSDFGNSDTNAGVAHLVEAVLFTFSAGFSAAGVFTATSEAIFLGLSFTGIGLALFVLACIVGLIASLMEDGPLVDWAGHTIWGVANNVLAGGNSGYGSLKKEQIALDQIRVGVRVKLNVYPQYDDVVSPVMKARLPRQARELKQRSQNSPMIAKLRMVFPKDNTFRWAFRIVGFPSQGSPVVLARQEHGLTFDRSVPTTAAGVQDRSFSNDEGELEQTIHYAHGAFDKVRATVLIYPPVKKGKPNDKPILHEILNAE